MPDAFIRGFPRAEDRVDEYRHVASHAPASSAASIGTGSIRVVLLGPGVTSLQQTLCSPSQSVDDNNITGIIRLLSPDPLPP